MTQRYGGWLCAAWLVAAGCGQTGGGGDADASGPDAAADAGCVAVFEQTVRVEPGATFAVRVDPTGTLTPDPQVDPATALSGLAVDAHAAAPAWVQPLLARTLHQLDPVDADTLAAEVLACDAATVDEVAWSIAVTHPALLGWTLENGLEGLFRENAEALYAVDGQVAYASLVELPDGRTTLALQGEAGAYQLASEMYYWYVVHPRAYIELPAYVGGDFWRTFFAEDTTHGSTVVDAVASAQTVQEAAAQVGHWIQGFMEFGYGTNDLQPVDIYHAQFGSCGQYSILTTAAARTVLLPTLSVAARADDHEWNELWDGRWIMWDNSLGEIGSNPHYPYIDMPEIMDDDPSGGSGVFGEVAHVLRYRPDGYVWPSELYTTYQPVELQVSDAAGAPLEGARIEATTAESGYLLCSWETTDGSGRATLPLGDDLSYRLLVFHPELGAHNPHPTVVTDETTDPYLLTVTYDEQFDRRFAPGGALPPGGLALRYQFTVHETEQHRVNLMTAGYELGDTYPVRLPGGQLDAFVVAETAYSALVAGDSFTGYGEHLSARTGGSEVSLPAGVPAYVVLDNRWWTGSVRFVELRVTTGCP